MAALSSVPKPCASKGLGNANIEHPKYFELGLGSLFEVWHAAPRSGAGSFCKFSAGADVAGSRVLCLQEYLKPLRVNSGARSVTAQVVFCLQREATRGPV